MSDPAETSGGPEQERPIQVDSYGIKAQIDRTPTGSQDIKSWKDVAKSVHASLKRLIAGGFGLAEDMVEGTRVLIRGIAAIPGATAKRIEDGQSQARKAERVAQQKLLTDSSAPRPTPEAALKRLETIQELLRAKGVELQIRIVDGQIVFSALRVEDAQLAAQIVKQLVPEDPPKVFVSGSASVEDKFSNLLDAGLGAAPMGLLAAIALKSQDKPGAKGETPEESGSKG